MAKSNKIKYDKLVRDNIPNILISQNKLFKAKTIKENQYLEELSKKLSEESSEVIDACKIYIPAKNEQNRNKLIEEMADLMEVYRTICKKYKLTPAEITEVMENKKVKNGGFDQGIFLEWVEKKEN